MLWTHEGKDQGYPLTTLYTSSLKERMQIREFTKKLVINNHPSLQNQALGVKFKKRITHLTVSMIW